MSGATEKVFNDRKVNQGFPIGTTYRDLVPGRWVKIRWLDGPDCWGVIIDHDERSHAYQGDRSIKVLQVQGKNKWRRQTITQEQIVEFGDLLSEPK